MTFTLSQPTRSELIRRINDQCRAAFTACAILVTAAFDQLDRKTKALALHRVRTFKRSCQGRVAHSSRAQCRLREMAAIRSRSGL